MELFVVLFLFGFVTAGDYYKNDDLRRIDSIRDERACISAGGRCVIATDCPELAEERGLCPQQQGKGVECCYGIKETRCVKFGGHCISLSESNCNERLTAKNATDCGHNSVCCVLV